MALTRRWALQAGAAGLTAALAVTATPAGATRAAVSIQPAAGAGRRQGARSGSRLLARVTPVGERITAVFVDVGVDLLGCRDLARAFMVTVSIDGGHAVPAPVARAYTRAAASFGEPEAGRYVVLELAGLDEDLVQPYTLEPGNLEPTLYREYAADGSVVQRPRVQATATPRYLGSALTFTVSRVAEVVTADGGRLATHEWTIPANHSALEEVDILGFQEGETHGDQPGNLLRYRLRLPTTRHGAAPLVVFLHGSGQVGADNQAHVLSSRGAIGVLDHEDAFVVAPQLPTVFDDFDPYDEQTGTGGGIHWQSRNRRGLVVALVRRLLRQFPQIDEHRVYVHGLSRGAEGALALVLDEPRLFAAAVMASGREAGTVEWMDGHATADLLRPALDTPLWFLHAAQDPIAPVTGTRVNVGILRELRHPVLRYTELSYEQPGDSGYVNRSAHNTWDLAYNSPDVWQWLLSQRRSQVSLS